jgi:Lysozyme like domain
MTSDQIAEIAYAAGFRDKGLSTSIAVALAESHGNPDAVGALGELGLWQIYPKAHPDWATQNLRDPAVNARAAFAISNSGANWRPWTTYLMGTYLLYLPQAEVSAQRVEKKGGIGATAAQALTHDPLIGSTNPLTSIQDAINFFKVGRNWGRLGMILIGGVIILIAVNTLTKPYTEPIVKTAVKLAK